MSGKKRGAGRRKRNLVYDVILLIALVVFLFCAYKLIGIYLDYKEASDTYSEVEREAMGDAQGPLIAPETEASGQTSTVKVKKTVVKPGSTRAASEPGETEAPEETEVVEEEIPVYTFNGDPAALKRKNKDFIGWIYVPGTRITYPMVQAADNDYYLRLTFDGVYNRAGSIFMDYLIRDGLDDKNPIIYGHNRKDGSMFASLKKYQDRKFYESHPYIYIFTEEGTRIYEVFSVYVTLPDSDTYTYYFQDDDQFLRYAAKMQSQSMFRTGGVIGAEDQIITLSTCTNREADTRFVVQAKRVYVE